MQRLPSIPIPPQERWRAIRIRALPFMMFAAALFCITVLWRQAVTPPTLVGEVERIESTLASPEAGTLTQLHVARFQIVAKGTPLAIIQPVDSRGPLDVMRSQLENLRARLNPEMNVLGYELNLQRLRLPWLQQKVDLATAESNLQFASTECTRAQALLKRKVITDQEYDLTLKKKQALETEVSLKKQLIVDLDQEIQKLQPWENANDDGVSIRTLLRNQEEKLKRVQADLGPRTIAAPIDGMISVVNRHAGESITAGEPILIMTALRSDHIIGYLREPFPFQPEVGMPVSIRTRAFHPLVTQGKITRVGFAFEPITTALRNPLLNSNARAEAGLPIEVSFPADLQVRPGGIVDLTLLPETRKDSSSRQL